MTPANETRRDVMRLAWSAQRAEPARAFADCLRGAWAMIKGLAKSAARLLARAKRSGGRINFSPSLARSPTTNSFQGVRFGRTLDRHAGEMISRLGQ